MWSLGVPEGELTYNWNNGMNTANIRVKPTTTTTYTLTITGDSVSHTQQSIVTVENISAGDDKIIYRGNSANLTATGGTSYSWSTGETTSSITVSPTHTTTYCVTGYVSEVSAIDTVVVYIIDTLNESSLCNRDSTTIFSNRENHFSIRFDGVDDRIYLGNPSILQTTGTITIEMWIYPISYGTNGSSIYYKSQKNEGHIYLSKYGYITYYYGTGSASQSVTSSSTIPLNTWSHIAIVRDFSNMKINIYINGQMSISKEANYSYSTSSSSNAYIGWGGGYPLNGNIDEFRLWNKALTQQEIINGMYKTYNPSEELNLKAYLKFDEGENDTTYDQTTNGVNGYLCAGLVNQTMANMPVWSTNIPTGLSYIWNNAATTPNIMVKPSETTTYIVTISNGIETITQQAIITVNECKKYDSNNNEQGETNLTHSTKISSDNILIYPVPVKDFITIDISTPTQSNIEINILNITGEKILYDKTYSKSYKKDINIKNIPEGMYLIKITINDKLYTRKINKIL